MENLLTRETFIVIVILTCTGLLSYLLLYRLYKRKSSHTKKNIEKDNGNVNNSEIYIEPLLRKLGIGFFLSYLIPSLILIIVLPGILDRISHYVKIGDLAIITLIILLFLIVLYLPFFLFHSLVLLSKQGNLKLLVLALIPVIGFRLYMLYGSFMPFIMLPDPNDEFLSFPTIVWEYITAVFMGASYLLANKFNKRAQSKGFKHLS